MTETAFRTARLFKVLGNPLRYKILDLLIHHPLSPTELSRQVSRSLPDVSRALSLLHWAGLIQYRTVGHRMIYSLKQAELSTFLHHGESLIRKFESSVKSPFPCGGLIPPKLAASERRRIPLNPGQGKGLRRPAFAAAVAAASAW